MKEILQKQKKGIQLNQAFAAVLTLVLVATLVIVALFMFGTLQTAMPTISGSTVNETGALNSAGHTMINATLCNYGSPSIVQIRNATDGQLITAGNYTLTGNVLKNATEVVWSTVLIDSTYTWGGPACQGTADTITQFSAYPALVGLVGTIIFLGLVIGVLVASFVFGGSKGA